MYEKNLEAMLVAGCAALRLAPADNPVATYEEARAFYVYALGRLGVPTTVEQRAALDALNGALLAVRPARYGHLRDG
jgi:hypothetical protein